MLYTGVLKAFKFYELLPVSLNFSIRNDLHIHHGWQRSYIVFLSSITKRRRMKLKMYQDKYFCFGIVFNHAKFLKDLTCQFLATPFSTIFLFNVLAHRYQKHRKNYLKEAKQIAHLNWIEFNWIQYPCLK